MVVKRRPIISLMIILFFIFISAILYSIDDFGGFYWQNYYTGVESWEWLYFNHIVSGPFMLLTLVLFVAILIILAVALFAKDFGSTKIPYVISLIILGLIFLISFLGMNAVWIVGVAGDYDDWWWDTACYVGNITPILIGLMLIYPLAKVTKLKREMEGKERGKKSKGRKGPSRKGKSPSRKKSKTLDPGDNKISWD